ncbi:hypothetical protein AQUCO_02000199v1 [Aquilegia coerulea]|uniref:FBD domain-containing protein n=1 Tax=Aquilegia coerulea TaxID=218851 RepID=A0A2G5DGF5_AQUCA|nr:hypothetical protein AQUCO_02000199v1 [Aquilegia coerulea]
MATKNRLDLLKDDDNDLSLTQLTELHQEILTKAKLAKLEIMKKKAEEQAEIIKKKAEEQAKIMKKKAEEEAKPRREPHLFRSIDLRNIDGRYFSRIDVNKLVKEAVDRSCRQLVEFSVDDHRFSSDQHLQYVVDKSIALKCLRFKFDGFNDEEVLIDVIRKAPFLEEFGLFYDYYRFPTVLIEAVGQLCPKLRCLRFSCPSYNDCPPDDEELRSEVLIKLVRKIPFLEELELCYYIKFPTELIKEVGRSCTQVKCLRLNGKYYYNWQFRVSDEDVLAISNHIPQLRRLHLSCFMFTNIGLEVMLNRCTNLEYLDIESCKYSDLEGSEQMKKKCEESGKTVRLPNYSIDDENIRRGDCWSDYGYNDSDKESDYGYNDRDKENEEDLERHFQNYLYQEYLDSLDNSIFLPKKINTCYL